MFSLHSSACVLRAARVARKILLKFLRLLCRQQPTPASGKNLALNKMQYNNYNNNYCNSEETISGIQILLDTIDQRPGQMDACM